MNESIKALLRHLLTAGAGYLAGKGLIGAEEINALVAGVLGLISVGWAIFDKKQAAVKLEKAIAAPAGKAE
jgi:hypothetical protein